MKILIISGTNRKNSKSFIVSTIYKTHLELLGVECEIINLADLPHNFVFSALYEHGGKNEEFNIFRNKVIDYQKFVFVVAEYNGSIPGVLKAFIDGLKYPDSFRKKKSALVGLSSGAMGGALALSHISDILSYLGANVLGNRVKLMHIEQHLKNEIIENKTYNDLIEAQVKEFVEF